MTGLRRKMQLQCWAGEAQAETVIKDGRVVGFTFSVEQLEVYSAHLAEKAMMLAQLKKDDTQVPPGWLEANVVQPIRMYFGVETI